METMEIDEFQIEGDKTALNSTALWVTGSVLIRNQVNKKESSSDESGEHWIETNRL